jgi:hypothetical protein
MLWQSEGKGEDEGCFSSGGVAQELSRAGHVLNKLKPLQPEQWHAYSIARTPIINTWRETNENEYTNKSENKSNCSVSRITPTIAVGK